MEVNGSPFCTQNAFSFLLFFRLVSPLQQHLRWRVLSPFSVTLPFRRLLTESYRNGVEWRARNCWTGINLTGRFIGAWTKKKTLVGKQKEKHEVETNNRDSGDAWRRVKWEFFFNFLLLLFWMICWNWNYKKTARSLPTRMLQRCKGYRTVLHFRYCLFSLLFWVMIYLPDIHKCRNRRVVAIWASESSRVIRVCWGRWIGCRPCKCDCRTTWCANLSV